MEVPKDKEVKMNAPLPSPESAEPTTPTPTSASPPPNELAPFQREARIVRELAVSSALHQVLALGQHTSPPGTKVYLDEMIRDCGQPSDPIEAMLVQQCAIAHHQIAGLQAKSASAKSLAEIKVYNGAACQLLGELRRLTLALKKYREPTAARHVTVVRQQNVAQNQQVAYLDGQAGSSQPAAQTAQNPSYSKLGSNKILDHVPNQPFNPQFETSRSRQEELVPAAGLHARGTGTTPPSCSDEETLEFLDGP
jgi:hypothetical protein